ncbi:MAG: VacJ family lipoprotein [Thiotrichales bacterium]|nr:VacJ family lipoprotein [Thiotrichales bacterium]
MTSLTPKPAELEDPELRSEQLSEEFNFLNSYDPLEVFNRHTYKFNAKFDEYIFLPILRTYRAVIPRFVHSGVRNFFANIGEIPVLLNSALQIKP